jgi:DNA-binding transcriptional LysR family regulator
VHVFDPRDLETLIAVADHGGIAAAARSLNCAQPAVSRRLQRLEHQAGKALLVRQSNGSALLPAGRLLAARSRVALDALSELERESVVQGPALGMLASVEGWMLPKLFERLSTTAANALLPVDCGATGGLQAVAQGSADAAIVSEWRSEHVPEGIVVLDLLLEPYLLLCPPGHQLLYAQSLGARALRGRAVVSAPHPDCGGAFAETGASQRMTASLMHAHGLVARGSGVAVWPSCTPTGPNVVARGMTDHRITRRLALATRNESLRSAAMRQIIEGVADAFRARPGHHGRFLWRGIPSPPVR